jgi:thiamine pyrophosphate-dependent enzyme
VAAPTIDAPAVKVLNRAELTKHLVTKLNRDEAVVAGIGNTNLDLYTAGDRPQSFYMLGSMGLACPIALGVALAQPERGIIALEGDGSILMALGCLTTIGMMKPRNLTIIIMDNGIYQITGKQAAATASSADIVASRAAPASATASGCATSATSRNWYRGASMRAGPRRRSTTSPGSGRRCATRRSSAIASCEGSAPAAAARWTLETNSSLSQQRSVSPAPRSLIERLSLFSNGA